MPLTPLEIHNKRLRTCWFGYQTIAVDALLDKAIYAVESILKGNGPTLHPDDLRGQPFPKNLRGYDPADVDAFLEEVARDLTYYINAVHRGDLSPMAVGGYQKVQEWTSETGQVEVWINANEVVLGIRENGQFVARPLSLTEAKELGEVLLKVVG